VNLANATSTTGTTLPTTAGKVTVKGGTGNDTITTSGTLTADVSIAAGDGTDVLAVGGAANISAIGALTSVETLDFNNIVAGAGTPALTLTPTQFNAFTTLQSTGGTLGNEKVTFSTNGTITIDSASKAGLKTYTLASGINTVTASTLPTVATAKIDASASSALNTINLLSGTYDMSTGAHTVTGGSGLTDVLNFTGNNAITVAKAEQLSGIENITFANTSTAVSFITDNAVIGTGNSGGNAYTNAVTVTNVASSSTFKFDAALDVKDRFNITNLATGGSTIKGGDGIDTIVGSSATDSIDGGGADDIITGAGGSDTLSGGAGNDTYIFNTGDVVSGETLVDKSDNTSSGNDTIKVVTSTDFTGLATATILTAGKVEQIMITSGQTATFNASQLTGQGININATAAGAATLEIKIPGNSQTVDFSTTALTFTAQTAPTAGNAFDTGVDIITITAAGTSDTITGTSIADSITTGGGTNTVDGKGGNDTITGGAGSDTITGGTGKDVLTGGSSNDTFKFVTGDTGSTTATADSITDLAVGDIIDLSGLSTKTGIQIVKTAKATVLSGNAAAVLAAGGLVTDDTKIDIYVATSGGNDYLVYETNVNGSTTEIVLIGAAAPGTLANWTLGSDLVTVA
jgi:Ca2+-binding RTX toxin-like protein